MKNELFYQLSLTFIQQIGAVQARLLIEKYGNASTIFSTGSSTLEKTEGIGSIRAASIRNFRDYDRVEKEMRFIEKHRIQPLFLTDPAYPQRLLNCYDPPTLLYYKGNADLNNPKVVAVVGTRLSTPHGKYLTDKLMEALAGTGALVVSGLAIGIDTLVHKAALKNGLPTAGVLAHGLDILYPPENSRLAKEILGGGGLLTEFGSKSKPDKHHFPSRNRIVAGLSDATVVIETGVKGGSIITAELANGYNREVFAFPGRITDTKSAGCNELIFNNKAVLLTDPRQIISSLGWDEGDNDNKADRKATQQMLFTELLPEEKIIMEIFQTNDTLHADELSAKSGLYGGKLATALLHLQLKELLFCLPGNRYKPV